MIQKIGAGIIVPPESVLDTHERTVLQVPTDKEKPGLRRSLTWLPVWIRHTWVTFCKERKKETERIFQTWNQSLHLLISSTWYPSPMRFRIQIRRSNPKSVFLWPLFLGKQVYPDVFLHAGSSWLSKITTFSDTNTSRCFPVPVTIVNLEAKIAIGIQVALAQMRRTVWRVCAKSWRECISLSKASWC